MGVGVAAFGAAEMRRKTGDGSVDGRRRVLQVEGGKLLRETTAKGEGESIIWARADSLPEIGPS
jgi:hypothetical protein